MQPFTVMPILHGRPFPIPHVADEAKYRLGLCSIARESVIYAEHLRATATDLCREFRDLRADRHRLPALHREISNGVDHIPAARRRVTG